MEKYSFDLKKYEVELTNIVNDLLKLDEVTETKLMQILRRYPRDNNKVFRKDHIIACIDWIIMQSEGETSTSHLQTYGLNVFRLQNLKRQISKKPTRTISGVTTVTVLTKPYPCPGRCIFCPNDIRMPKSYIANEPGAQRALSNRFDSYMQVFNRLKAYRNNGHPTDKIELLILGGTWSSYPPNYKRWFVKECFRAMNEFEGETRGERLETNPTLPSPLIKGEVSRSDGGVADQRPATKDLTNHPDFANATSGKQSPITNQSSTYYSLRTTNSLNKSLREKLPGRTYNQLILSKEYTELSKGFITQEKETSWEELEEEQVLNSRSKCRCVGLVLETRPSLITAREVLELRRYGATKIQIGVQTLDDEVSRLNKRGEAKKDIVKAFRLLRLAGFKIHAHIMPNLYSSDPKKDLKTYKELFESEDFKPDELKIYPVSVIENTELFKLYTAGKYKSYSSVELVELIFKCIEITPQYCRLSRIIRDIPSSEIKSGNETTNLREVVEKKLKSEGIEDQNIRAREIKNENVGLNDLELDIVEYKTSVSTEFFLQYINQQRKVAGFVRLSLPHQYDEIIPELKDCAIIREVHVYGPSLELSKDSSGQAQHLGLGTKLIDEAKKISKQSGFGQLAVISSIGTREYYDKRGFKLNHLYQIATL